MRRGSFILLASCAAGLTLGVSYLGESPAQASTTQGDAVEGQVSRLVEVRQKLRHTLDDRAHEIAYGLEHAKDELEELIP